MAGQATRVATMAMVVARFDRSCCINSVSLWTWAPMLATSAKGAVGSLVSSILSGLPGCGLVLTRARLEGKADRVSLTVGWLGAMWEGLNSKASRFGVGVHTGNGTGGRVHPCERKASVCVVRRLTAGASSGNRLARDGEELEFFVSQLLVSWLILSLRTPFGAGGGV